MKRPRICATITANDTDAIRQAEPHVDLYEVRIDLIGDDWEAVAGQLGKPWIACNRTASEGGGWQGTEARRIEKLLRAMELGADLVDVELRTENLGNIVRLIRRRTRCLLSYHDLEKTPASDTMRQIVQEQVKAGADVCKLVTTARSFEDNLSVLGVIEGFGETTVASTPVVSFAMGSLGGVSRVLCPLVGGDFTYASLGAGRESAPGQMAAADLRRMYDMVTE
jgi:3-dehydroquinate dehydratase type I